MNSEKLTKIGDVAQLLGVTTQMLRNWTNSGDMIKPRLKPSSPYHNWAKLHDFFKHCGITSFKTSEVMKRTLQMKYALNSATSEQPDNLRAGLSSSGKIEDWHKFWNFIEISNFL